MPAFIKLLILLMPACFSLQIEQFKKEDVCTAEAQKLGEDSELKTCTKMTHSKVYKSSSEREVIVRIMKSRIIHQRYPLNFNITILRIWHGNYTSIDNCCSLDKPCKLPASDGAEYTIVAPTASRIYPFCHKTIHVTRGMPEWCYINPKCPCVYLDNGTLTLNDTYYDLCGTDCSKGTKTDFCFFELPGRFGQYGHKTSYGLTVNVQNVTFSRKRACEEGKRREGVLSSLSSLFQSYDAKPGNTICAYYRMKTNYTADWRRHPICLTDPVPFPWRIILIIVAISLTVLIVLIGLAILYRKHIKTCFPSYKKTVEEMKSMKFDLSTNSEDGSFKKYEKDIEIPNKILGNGDTPYRRVSLETQRYIIVPSSNHRCTSGSSINEDEDQIFHERSNRVDDDDDQLSEKTVETPCDNEEQDSKEFFPPDDNNDEPEVSGYMQKDFHSALEPTVVSDLNEIEFCPYQSKFISFTSTYDQSHSDTEVEIDSNEENDKLKAEQTFLNKFKLLSNSSKLNEEDLNADAPEYMMHSQNSLWTKSTSTLENIDWTTMDDGYVPKEAVRILPANKLSSNILHSTPSTPQKKILPALNEAVVSTDGDYMSKNALF
uniref:uncharacterized protein LOC120336719 n=1 Tax=Styela clava TaxID=7725 RepID=UPI001939835A|nr:uncharacterized protein LOC120336719 [Styela clava]